MSWSKGTCPQQYNFPFHLFPGTFRCYWAGFWMYEAEQLGSHPSCLSVASYSCDGHVWREKASSNIGGTWPPAHSKNSLSPGWHIIRGGFRFITYDKQILENHQYQPSCRCVGRLKATWAGAPTCSPVCPPCLALTQCIWKKEQESQGPCVWLWSGSPKRAAAATRRAMNRSRLF